MGTGWRRAFCNTVARERRDSAVLNTTAVEPEAVDKQQHSGAKLAGSNPLTPRLRCKINASNASENVDLVSPNCGRNITPKSNSRSPRTRIGSNPSSPRSPFSILKNTLRLSRNNCGVCMQSVKTGQGMAIYTAECSHAFHFPCIASHVRKQSNLICPVCNTNWKDVPLLAIHTRKNPQPDEEKIVVIDSASPIQNTPVSVARLAKNCEVKSYADDEPLVTPKAGAKFVPIPEAVKDEEDDEVEEFQGFFVNPISSSYDSFDRDSRNVVVSLLPEAAVISQGRTHDTYAVVLKIKAPPPPPPKARDASSRRAPIDLVTVLDVSGSMTGAKLEMLKRTMRLVISSLGSADRLSIVAFAATPKRLLPLRRMTAHGQRSARRIIDRLACSHGSSMAEALKQATRVLEERRERNPVASIILLSDGHNDTTTAPPATTTNNHPKRTGSSHIPSTRFSHVEIPVHTSGFGREPAEDAFSKCVGGLLSVVVQDLRIQIGFGPGSDPAEITAVYSYNERPVMLGSSCVRLGDLYAEEEKELLVEIRVPSKRVGSHHVLSVKCGYKDPVNQEPIYGRDQALLVPRPAAMGSSMERLRNSFVTVRAIAESRRLTEHGEMSSAMQLLSSARALLVQWRTETAGECVKELEAEMREVLWRRQYEQEMAARQRTVPEVMVDENGEPLTPTSAWRAAEKLAKMAHMKNSANRVGDLHGFENARF